MPPYWETTIHAPSSANIPGEIIIDSIPTGSIFSFLWNMLVSISFQFVGFLLTYLLHTTHAAKLGSRAGLGITLIQYGFALRGKSSIAEDNQAEWTGWQKPDDPAPTFATAAEAEAYYNNPNSTIDSVISASPQEGAYILGDAASEWLSFVLMTVGGYCIDYSYRVSQYLLLLKSLRLVYSPYLPPQFLACETLGAGHSLFPTCHTSKPGARSACCRPPPH